VISRFEEMSMEFTPDSSPAKRSRAQPKPAAEKKPRAARKSPTATTTAPTDVVLVASPGPTREDVGSMIATAAYYLAAARNFSPGHELDDWLEAERAVHAKLYS
jgi:hypothetical protein